MRSSITGGIFFLVSGTQLISVLSALKSFYVNIRSLSLFSSYVPYTAHKKNEIKKTSDGQRSFHRFFLLKVQIILIANGSSRG